jgi:hypothetical protein
VYSSTLSITSALDGMGCQCHAPTSLHRERPSTRCVVVVIVIVVVVAAA